MLQDSARSTTWKQDVFNYRLRTHFALAASMFTVSLEKCQKQLCHSNWGDANLKSTNLAIRWKSYCSIIMNNQGFKLGWENEKHQYNQLSNTLFHSTVCSLFPHNSLKWVLQKLPIKKNSRENRFNLILSSLFDYLLSL